MNKGGKDGKEVSVVAKHTVRPLPRAAKKVEGEEAAAAAAERIHLTPWDLRMISSSYIQKGILFHKPEDQPMYLIISNLLDSFSIAINHFYPLAGRLVTTKHGDSSIFISLDCTDENAEFVHASASNLKVSDILASYYIPPIVHSFFPLNGMTNYDGHHLPLLAVQFTELADGIFIACSFNHSVADGTSFWHFFNTWSTICRASANKNMNQNITK